MIEIVKIHLMDLLFSYLNVWSVRQIDPVSKIQFERYLIILNFIFSVSNHFAVLLLIRLYIPIMHDKCNLIFSDNILKQHCEELQLDDPTLDCGDSLQTDQYNNYHLQKMSIGCMAEIKNFYGTYVIVFLLLSLIRLCISARKKKLLFKQQNEKRQTFKQFYEQKYTLFNKIREMKTKTNMTFQEATKQFAMSRSRVNFDSMALSSRRDFETNEVGSQSNKPVQNGTKKSKAPSISQSNGPNTQNVSKEILFKAPSINLNESNTRSFGNAVTF